MYRVGKSRFTVLIHINKIIINNATRINCFAYSTTVNLLLPHPVIKANYLQD